MRQQSNSLSLAGLILGIISLVIAFVPCIGSLGSPLALIGLILSIVGFNKDKQVGASTGLAIGGIVTSALAILVTLAYMFFFGNLASSATVEISSCEEALPQFEEALAIVEELSQMDDGEGDLSLISKAITAGSTLATIDEKVKELGCLSDPDFKAKYEALQARRKKID